jgi:GTP-binding protein
VEIKQSVFIKSAAAAADFVRLTLPEIAVSGRSNAGKSSLINMLTRNGALARVSKAAGRTRLVNYFEINKGQFYLVDLPGYGYSAAGSGKTEEFGGIASQYITESRNLRHVLILADIRLPPSPDDLRLTEYLYHNRVPFTVLAAKSDKLPRPRIADARTALARGFKIGRDDVIAISSKTGEGRTTLLALFDRILSPL